MIRYVVQVTVSRLPDRSYEWRYLASDWHQGSGFRRIEDAYKAGRADAEARGFEVSP